LTTFAYDAYDAFAFAFACIYSLCLFQLKFESKHLHIHLVGAAIAVVVGLACVASVVGLALRWLPPVFWRPLLCRRFVPHLAVPDHVSAPACVGWDLAVDHAVLVIKVCGALLGALLAHAAYKVP
jgi:hypothetical protein